MILPLSYFLYLSSVVFAIGVLGIFLKRRSIISLIMSVELMLLAVVINLLSFAAYWGDLNGHVLVLMILSVSAAEVAVVLSAVVVHFSYKKSIILNK